MKSKTECEKESFLISEIYFTNFKTKNKYFHRIESIGEKLLMSLKYSKIESILPFSERKCIKKLIV